MWQIANQKMRKQLTFFTIVLSAQGGFVRTEADEAALESRASSLHIPCCDSSQPATANLAAIVFATNALARLDRKIQQCAIWVTGKKGGASLRISRINR